MSGSTLMPDGRLKATSQKGGGGLAAWTAHYPEWILAFAALASWFAVRDIRLSHDTYWQFWVARQLLGGARLYNDIWEVNPPLWFWSAMPVEWLSERTGVSWQYFQLGLVLFCGLVSTLLVTKLIPIADRRYRLVFSVVVFLVATIVPLGDIGQRDHLTLVLSLPFAALIARRHAGLGVPNTLALVTGLLAAYAFAMKHYFIIAPLALELWLLFKLRKAWSPWRPETMALAVAAVAYAIAILLITPGFLTIAVPANLVAYGGMQMSLVTILETPWVVYWAVCAAFLCLASRRWGDFGESEANAFTSAAIILWAAYALAYYLQHKVAYYHSVPGTGALVIAVCLATWRLHIARSALMPIGAVLLALPLSFQFAPDPNYVVSFAKPSIEMLETVPAGEVAFVAAQDPRIAWPAVEQRHLVWPSRASSFWMLNQIDQAELDGRVSPDLARLSSQVVASVSEDLRCNPPYLIVIPHDFVLHRNGRSFDLREYLFRDSEFRLFVAQHYQLLPDPVYGYSYKRQGHVEGMHTSHCRTVH